MIAPNAPDAAAQLARDAQEALSEPYAYLTDAQYDLYDRMREISEDSHCAGWIGDNEFNI